MGLEVYVHDDAVDIDLDGWDRICALWSHCRLATADIVAARVAPRDELRESASWRLPGTHVPGYVASGRFATKDRPGVHQLWDTFRDDELLVIETRLDSPWRVVLQHPDRERLAWLIAERIGR